MASNPVYYLERRRLNMSRVKRIANEFGEPTTDNDALRFLAETYRTTPSKIAMDYNKAQRYHISNRVYRKSMSLEEVGFTDILDLSKLKNKALWAGLVEIANDTIDQTGRMLLVFNSSVDNKEAFKYTNETVFGPGLPEDFLRDNVDEYAKRFGIKVQMYHKRNNASNPMLI